MKTVTSFDFTREFFRYSKEPCVVTKRGKRVGTWHPDPKAPEPVDFLARQRADGFTSPLPFTGAQLLKEGKR